MAAGRRVRVVLRDGYDSASEKRAPTEPIGWAADGRGGADWSDRPGRHAIAFWSLIG